MVESASSEVANWRLLLSYLSWLEPCLKWDFTRISDFSQVLEIPNLHSDTEWYTDTSSLGISGYSQLLPWNDIYCGFYNTAQSSCSSALFDLSIPSIPSSSANPYMPANSGLFSILFSFPQSMFFSFFLKFFGVPCVLWNLSSRMRDQTRHPLLKKHSLNHWTTGEVPHILLINPISSQGFESQLCDATGKENLSLLPF